MWLWGEFWCITMAINIWTFFFVVVFNNQFQSAIEYDSLEKCLVQQYAVEKDPSLLLGAGDEFILHNSISHYNINPIRGLDATRTRI